MAGVAIAAASSAQTQYVPSLQNPQLSLNAMESPEGIWVSDGSWSYGVSEEVGVLENMAVKSVSVMS
jgi:hypothetical protein